jgi:hypothetical protein
MVPKEIFIAKEALAIAGSMVIQTHCLEYYVSELFAKHPIYILVKNHTPPVVGSIWHPTSFVLLTKQCYEHIFSYWTDIFMHGRDSTHLVFPVYGPLCKQSKCLIQKKKMKEIQMWWLCLISNKMF